MKIPNVLLTPLKIVRDERGSVMHFLREGRAPFEHFGEAYFSTVNPGVTKGWKLHRRSTSNMAVVSGAMRFWLRDEREGSATKGQTDIVDLAPVEGQYHLLTIPPGVVYAWKSTGDIVAIACNGASLAWEPDESVNLPLETWPLT